MSEEEKAEAVWAKIVSFLEKQEGNSYEFKTVRLDDNRGVWFSASAGNNLIAINRAVKQNPSADINGERRITRDAFTRIYPFYEKWRTREIPRGKIGYYDVNTSYIFGMIAYFKDNEGNGS
jgi:hypothetical protein